MDQDYPGMISIRKYIEAYRESATTPAVPAQETRETAIPEYRALLVAIGRSADLALPSLQFRLESTLRSLEEALVPPVPNDVLDRTNQEVREHLSQWTNSALEYRQGVERELQELVSLLAATARSLSERDAKYTREISDLTGRLSAVAEEGDLPRIRRSILENTRVLKDCVVRMAKDSKSSVEHLTAEVKEYQSRLAEAERASDTDALTGLANRRSFEKHLRSRTAKGKPFSLILIDLNDFKLVNDRFGHVAGDDLIKQFAVELKALFGPDEMVARWGGDEFVAVVSGRMNYAQVTISRIQRWSLGEYRITQGDQKVKISLNAAIGAAEWDGIETGDRLLARADREVYRAKAPAGRIRSSS
jgi:diguanylate cyclase (GGDEF)-like protein